MRLNSSALLSGSSWETAASVSAGVSGSKGVRWSPPSTRMIGGSPTLRWRSLAPASTM